MLEVLEVLEFFAPLLELAEVEHRTVAGLLEVLPPQKQFLVGAPEGLSSAFGVWAAPGLPVLLWLSGGLWLLNLEAPGAVVNSWLCNTLLLVF